MADETKSNSIKAGRDAADDGVQRDYDFGSNAKLVGFILTVTSSQLITVAQLGVVAYPELYITREFSDSDVNLATAAWFLAAYSLTAGTFVLVSGQLGDILGHKRIFALGWAWMAVWTLVSSFAESTTFFCICRALAGLGSALLSPNGMALLGRAFTPQSVKKNVSFALLGAKAPAGYIFGGVFGALLAQLSSWRWAMRLLAFLSFALAGLSVVLIPQEVGARSPTTSPSFDWQGAILGSTGLILLSFAWNQAGVVGWQEPYTYALLIVAVIALVAFAIVETKVTHPLLPPVLWSRPGFSAIIVSMSLGWMSFGIWLYFTTTFLMQFRLQTPLGAVAQMVPLVPMGIVATACVGAFINRVPAQFIFGTAMLAFFVGNLLMSLTPSAGQTYWAMVFPACVLVPFGPDLSFASAALLVSDVAGASLQGVAASFVNLVVLFSVSLGLGIAGVAQRYVLQSSQDPLHAYRCAYFLATGMAALGFLIVVSFVRDKRQHS